MMKCNFGVSAFISEPPSAGDFLHFPECLSKQISELVLDGKSGGHFF